MVKLSSLASAVFAAFTIEFSNEEHLVQLCNLPTLFFLAFIAAVFSVLGGFEFLLEAEDGRGVRREGLGVLEGADAGLGFFKFLTLFRVN